MSYSRSNLDLVLSFRFLAKVLSEISLMNVVKNEMQERKKPDRRYNKCERNVLENQKQ